MLTDLLHVKLRIPNLHLGDVLLDLNPDASLLINKQYPRLDLWLREAGDLIVYYPSLISKKLCKKYSNKMLIFGDSKSYHEDYPEDPDTFYVFFSSNKIPENSYEIPDQSSELVRECLKNCFEGYLSLDEDNYYSESPKLLQNILENINKFKPSNKDIYRLSRLDCYCERYFKQDFENFIAFSFLSTYLPKMVNSERISEEVRSFYTSLLNVSNLMVDSMNCLFRNMKLPLSEPELNSFQQEVEHYFD